MNFVVSCTVVIHASLGTSYEHGNAQVDHDAQYNYNNKIKAGATIPFVF